MPADRPNVVYILADDMGYGDLSCLNADSKIRTTHLDRMASQGMRFRDAHASSAVCTPSRYSILTGRYNFRSVLKRGVTGGYSQSIIEEDRITLAAHLKQHGYHTACVGKWHLGWTWPLHSDDAQDIDFTRPIERGPCAVGFDEYFGIPASLDMPPYVYIEGDTPTAVPDHDFEGTEGKLLCRAGPTAPDFVHEDVLQTLTDRSVNIIKQRGEDGQPFFLYFPLPAPHTPILPTEAFRGKSGTNEYGDFCLQVDDVVGQIMTALDDAGLADNTILVFTADNGCSPIAGLDELAQVGHAPSYVFRGHKADIYEGGHRIPLVVRWPKAIAADSFCDQTVCLTDLFATMADVLGDALPDHIAEDSVSNLPVWRGDVVEGTLREATVHTSVDGSLSIRQGRWKLEMCAGSGGWSAPRPGPDCEGLPPRQLYDLDADISERTNLIDTHPDIAQQLQDLLTTYIRNGRSTPGTPQENWGGCDWDALWWMKGDGAAT